MQTRLNFPRSLLVFVFGAGLLLAGLSASARQSLAQHAAPRHQMPSDNPARRDLLPLVSASQQGPSGSSASVKVGPKGGALALDGFQVTIPPNLLPEPVTLTVHRLPSQAGEVAQVLDPSRFRAIGPVFEFETSFLATTPLTLTLAYADDEIPAGFQAANLGILTRTTPRPESLANANPQHAFFSPWPATVAAKARTVQLAIFGSGAFQVVAMAAPLIVYEEPSFEPDQVDAGAAAPQAASSQIFQVVFVDTPDDADALKNEIMGALRRSWRTFVLDKSFEARASRVTVKVQTLGDCGQADFPATIVVYPSGSCHLPTTVAHEYFHLIQILVLESRFVVGPGR